MTQEPKIAVQKIFLEDGRVAERRSYKDEQGNEIIELYAEAERPLNMEQRTIREFKTVVAKETYQVIQNGEVVSQDVFSTEPDVPLQIRERIVVQNPEAKNNDFVTKAELSELLAANKPLDMPQLNSQPISAQYLVEKNVEDKSKNKAVVNLVLAGILIINILFIGYVYFMM